VCAGRGSEAAPVRALPAVTPQERMALARPAIAGSGTTHANSNVADVSAAVATRAISDGPGIVLSPRLTVRSLP